MKKKLMKMSSLVIFSFLLVLVMSINLSARQQVVVKKNNRHAYREIIVKDRHFFYRGGYFYDRGPRGYIKIAPPIGARIMVLPRGCQVIKIRKERYYVFGGVYYRYIPREKVYVVIEKPL